MHPVLTHLNERKDQKVPVADNRKIIAVVFGGTMNGICGAGALAGLGELGFGNSFDEIYSYSAGFANAASFLSQRIVYRYQIYYEDLTSKKFINLWRFWRIVNIDYLVSLLRSKECVKSDVVLGHPTKLFVYLKNLSQKRYEFLEVHKVGEKDFWGLMKTAMSIPYFTPGSVQIGNYRYKDPGFMNAEIRRYIEATLATDATDIIFITNNTKQKNMVEALAKLSDRIYIMSPSAKSSLSKLENRSEVVKQAADAMKTQVHSLFA